MKLATSSVAPAARSLCTTTATVPPYDCREQRPRDAVPRVGLRRCLLPRSDKLLHHIRTANVGCGEQRRGASTRASWVECHEVVFVFQTRVDMLANEPIGA